MIVASLPMYDWPEFRGATDVFWNGFAKHASVHGELRRDVEHSELWKQEELYFSQTCGYPFTHDFKGLLSYVATPHYAVDGCEGPEYCSIVLSREHKPISAFFGGTAAINAVDSMSGMLALKLAVAAFVRDGEFFRRAILTGGHRKSLMAVRNKTADICAVDAVCVALARRYCPQELEGLVEIGRTPMVPGLPFVTRSQIPNLLVDVLRKTFADTELKDARQSLFLSDFSVLPDGAYQKILALENALPQFNS